jgi:uncharacterized DUF497 family protein
MDFEIEFNEDKNRLLKETRDICFDDIIELIKKDKIIKDVRHHNLGKYQRQRIFILKIKSYIYAVPYVVSLKKKIVFLKTIYPSRKYKKNYEKKL